MLINYTVITIQTWFLLKIQSSYVLLKQWAVGLGHLQVLFVRGFYILHGALLKIEFYHISRLRANQLLAVEHKSVSVVDRGWRWAAPLQLSSVSIQQTQIPPLCNVTVICCCVSLFLWPVFVFLKDFFFSNETYLFVNNKFLVVAALMFCSRFRVM